MTYEDERLILADLRDLLRRTTTKINIDFLSSGDMLFVDFHQYYFGYIGITKRESYFIYLHFENGVYELMSYDIAKYVSLSNPNYRDEIKDVIANFDTVCEDEINALIEQIDHRKNMQRINS